MALGNRTGKRRWDEYGAYLFDIDGTLLSCADAVHYFAFCEALRLLSGRALTLDGVTAHGNTDVGILRDALALAKVPEAEWRPRLAQAQAGMSSFVEQRRDDLCITVLPGVIDVLTHLRQRHAVLGVATGNLERIGRAKLSRVGLLKYFDFGGFSDIREFRRDVFQDAFARARELAGEQAETCVIGDTPQDIRAARWNGLDIIAVATGIYSFGQLHAEAPDWCLHSLEELPR